MKKFVMAVALCFMAFAITGCGMAKVPAGNVGVKVNLLGGDKGVDNEVVGPGRYFLTWNQDMFIFPTFTQNYGWTKDNDPAMGSPNDESIEFQSTEGMLISADVGISYHIQPDKVALVFQKYRRGVAEITDIYLRNMVRDALVTESATMKVDAVYGEKRAELMDKVTDDVKRQVEPIGIVVEKLYWIGALRLPQQVTDAINAKLQATQKAQQRENEVAQSRAEADKKIEEARGDAQSTLLNAQAQAQANKLLGESITPELVRYQFVSKWDGILSKVSGGDTMSMLMNGDSLLKENPKPVVTAKPE
jgi:regulator of protease activity HflC (stomatin/prohibitin superfamily)